MSKPSILVVNSLVARGGVGGRASVFALERLGFPVIFVPTVILSWHPGHGRATRMTPETATFSALVADIAGAGWLHEVGAVLSGYFGDAEQVTRTARLVAAVRAVNPAALYLCDPVIGDNAGLFQPEALASAIRDQLLPLADIVTPNRFELGWLAQNAMRDLDGVAGTARRLGPREVVVTSAPSDEANERLTSIVAAPSGTFEAAHRLLPGPPNGTGDLFAALYLGHRVDGAAPEDAVARAASTVLAMVAAAVRNNLDELPLAACQDAIPAAPRDVTITRLDPPDEGQSAGRRNTPRRKPA